MPNLRASVATVENAFFGSVVTVSGLLTARDILRGASKGGRDPVSCPAPLDGEGEVFLDGMTLRELREETPATVVVAGTIAEVVQAPRRTPPRPRRRWPALAPGSVTMA